jgi:NADH pyrophosphatase NudC (nudix superfamily)
MFDKCPGAQTILAPTIKLKACPQCGEEIEMVSIDMKTICSGCGFIVYNDVASCVQWCQYAKECVGEEVYKRLKKEA